MKLLPARHLKAWLCLLFFSLVFFCNNSGAEYYKWVDENGVAHFTDTPSSDTEVLDLKTIDIGTAAHQPSGSSLFVKEDKFLYCPGAKRLTAKQASRIEQNIFRIQWGAIWFVRINVNDYSNDLWLLDADIFWQPREQYGRLHKGLALSLGNVPRKSPDAPENWPTSLTHKYYYHVSRSIYSFSGYDEPPSSENIPIFVDIDETLRLADGRRIDHEAILELWDVITAHYDQRDDPLEGIRFYRNAAGEDGELKYFTALTWGKAIRFEKTNGNWIVESRGVRRFHTHDLRLIERVTKIPESCRTTSLTEERALEICRPALEKRLANDSGRIVQSITKTEFTKYPGTSKSMLRVFFISTNQRGWGAYSQSAFFKFEDEEIKDLDL